MALSTLRFMVRGWVENLYVHPKLFFPYYGFEWVQPLPGIGMHVVFGFMFIAFIGVALGWYYRSSAFIAFLLFTYVELIDKTNYLNHYYFVSIICFLLLFLPAHRWFSLDVKQQRVTPLTDLPQWVIGILRLQIGMVYFFAGLAKLNADWLLEALPLNLWLKSFIDVPVIGPWLGEDLTAYAFSWFGAIYDLSIPFLLLFRKTRTMAYAFVILFHTATALLFPIGMFPWIMMLCTLVFFPASFHQRWMRPLHFLFDPAKETTASPVNYRPNRIGATILIGFLLIQLALPFRHLLYPGKLFWTEQGYRFSWRVMLMEKAGYAIFHIEDLDSGRKWEVNNYDYLTPNQEKMMATQADMLLQFAHHLRKVYAEQGLSNLRITVENYVSLNGRRSQLMIDPEVDLSKVKDSFAHKPWILPFKAEKSS
jgi:hypothetical protein